MLVKDLRKVAVINAIEENGECIYMLNSRHYDQNAIEQLNEREIKRVETYVTTYIGNPHTNEMVVKSQLKVILK